MPTDESKLTSCWTWIPSSRTLGIALSRKHDDVTEVELLSTMTQCPNPPIMICHGPYGSGGICQKHIDELKRTPKLMKRATLTAINAKAE